MDEPQRVQIAFRECVYAIDPDRVDLEDFVQAMKRNGGLVRVTGDPHDAIMVLYPVPVTSGRIEPAPRLDWEAILIAGALSAIILILSALAFSYGS